MVETPTAGPFSLIDGDVLRITVNGPGGPVARDVFFHPEDFANLSQARPAEVAAVLDREVPGIDATLSPTGAVRLLTRAVGSSATIMLAPSTALAKLDLGGLPPVATGLDAAPAILASSTVGPYALADQDTLTFAIDGREPHTATFSFAQFPALAAGAAGDIAQAINQVVPGAADVTGGRLRLLSAVPGDRSMVVLDGNRSTAAIKLGFAAPPPAGLTGLDDAEPSAFEDSSGQVWLFFASRRSGSWNLWYTRFAGGSWGVPKPLTAGLSPDREPSATIDLASGRIWVFWSRKKSSGLWNVFSRRTTKLDFGTIADADWTEAESSPAPADFDNREPAVLVTGADALDLYFASNRADGWNVWRKTASSAAQGAEAAVTSGPFTRRAPAALVSEGGGVIVWLRSNESQLYASTLYSAATTLDARYAGSVTIDTRNPARVRLGGSYADIMRYTYDTPKTDVAQESARRYSHDTIGVFLTPDTQDQQLIVRNQALIAQVLRRFLPIQARAVFPIELAYNDAAYDYETPGVASPRFIKASKTDTIAGVVVGANSAD